ncbi:DUF5134 domain-containing protein [Streptomyces sp. NPDC048290]|uniref:DUF5134 domain-containing protein n=1 Tax=Streptomyces sp. NPDC048290 TaxID=3155811 RepID=UPI003423E7BC
MYFHMLPGSAWPGWLLVALCAANGVYGLLRMRSNAAEQRRGAGDEALMGFGMAVMALPATVFTPPSWTWPGYAAVTGAVALRTLWVAGAGTHHLVGASAMIYMAMAMAASPGQHTGHGGAGVPLLTWALFLYFVGYVLHSGVRLLPAAAASSRAVGWGNRPELVKVSRLSMGIAMTVMLVTL